MRKFNWRNFVVIVIGLLVVEMLFRSVVLAAEAVTGSASAVVVEAAPVKNWIAMLGGWPVVLPILFFVAVRIETYYKNRWSVKVASAMSVGHALFNAAAANGLISNELSQEADDFFWKKIDTQFIDSHGAKGTEAQQSIAHKQFQELFTANTQLPPPATKPKVDEVDPTTV